jgi:hypothetical protein
MEDEVRVLREFRDKYLLTNAAGQRFVNLYCRYSPPVANYISAHEKLKTATKMALMPVIYSIKYPMILGFVVILGGVTAIRKKLPRLTIRPK